MRGVGVKPIRKFLSGVNCISLIYFLVPEFLEIMFPAIISALFFKSSQLSN